MSFQSKFAVCVAAGLAALSVRALDFPGGDTPSVTEPGTYVSTDNLTYQTMSVGGDGAFVFNLSGGPHTATLTGTGGGVMKIANGTATDLTLRGGAWFFADSASEFNSNGGGRAQGWKLTLDGATMSGLKKFWIARDTDSYASVVLTNGASLTAGELWVNGYNGGAQHNSFDVMAGSSFTGSVYTDKNDGDEDIDARVLADGAGSKIVGAATIGNGHRNCRLEVLNGASYQGDVSLAKSKKSYDCRLVVSNGASYAGANLNLGAYNAEGVNAPTHDNSVLIADGATAEITDTLYLGCAYLGTGASNNVFEVRDASLTVNKLRMKGSDCVGNTFKIVGENATLTTTGWKGLSESGRRNRFIVDGANWVCTSSFGMGNGTDNEVFVINGAKAVLSSDDTEFMIGANDSTYSYQGNSVTIGDTAFVEASKVKMSGDSNTLTISNGTLRANKDGGSSWTLASMRLGYINTGYGYLGTNLVITLQGERPSIESPATVLFENNITLRVELPAGGYAAGHVPITGKKVSFNYGNGNSFIVPEVTAFRSGLTGPATVTIARATDELGAAADGIIARSNAIAPDGCTFSTSGNDLILTVDPPARKRSGFALILK